MAFKNTDDETLDDERDASLGEGGSARSEDEIEGRKAAEDSDEGAGERDADDTGDDADPAKAVVGLKKRLAKLTAQRNDARKRAEERDALDARVRAYEAKERESEERQRAAERTTPEGMKAAERRQAIRDAIDEAYGDGTSSLLEDQRSERALQKEQYALTAVGHLRSELEDHGIVTDDTTLIRWERAVGSEMAEDAQLHAAFKRPATMQAALKVAFERVRDGLANPAIKQQGGRPLERIERNRAAVLGGGRSGSVDQVSEPEYTAKPPKGLQGQALEDWWTDHRDKLWKRLNDQGVNA